MSTPIYFPQINGNLILTQLPYNWGFDFATINQEVETGMRFSFPTREAGLTGFPTTPLSKFGVNFSRISDAEVNTLYSFFLSMRGRWGEFRFLDPGGNLLKFSEDFNNVYWSKTLSVGAAVTDPFKATRAKALTSGIMLGVVGPSDGGMNGLVLCSSVWVKSASGTALATVGLKDNTTLTIYAKTYVIGTTWQRISFNLVLPTNNQFLFYLQLVGSCNVFGAQVSPMKGEGAYVEVPGNYGYHQHVRFDTDSFTVQAVGPNENQVTLPLEEFNV